MASTLSRRVSRRAPPELYVQDANLFRQNLGRATRFDGSSIIHTGSLLGGSISSANGKEGTLHCWMRMPADQAAFGNIMANTGSRLEFNITSDEHFQVRGASSPLGTIVLDVSSTNFYRDAKFHHVLVAWKLDALPSPLVHMYIDDADDTTTTTATDAAIDYNRNDWAIGGNPNGFANVVSDIAELWFAAERIDITVEANRRRFISAQRSRVYLGERGQRPLVGAGATLTRPNIFVNGGPNLIRRNYGSGVSFNTNIEGQPKYSSWPTIRVGV